MAEYIEREALLKELTVGEEYLDNDTMVAVFDTVVCFPAADVAPVVHGQWVKDGDWLIFLNCESEINVKNSLGVENRTNYCPNCGAKMDGGTNG